MVLGAGKTSFLRIAACMIGYYHSRLAQSWAGVASGISKYHSSSPILAAHYPLPKITGSTGTPSFVNACPR